MVLADKEIISLQAKKIYELESDAERSREKLKDIKMQLIHIGAPLNDNLLQYSSAQLKPFFKIQDIIDG
jgi:hypothetical protein